MLFDIGEDSGTDMFYPMKNICFSKSGEIYDFTYETLVRCSVMDAEPRFDGVDWSFSSTVVLPTRRGVANWVGGMSWLVGG